jgi:hypothetical protein
MKTTTCYLLHFDQPIGNTATAKGWAQHYLGSSADLATELAVHARVTSHAAIMRAVNGAGIGWELVRTWPGGRGLERRLKQRGPVRYCPKCSGTPRHGWYLEDAMYGGYSVVAAVINQRFRPEPPIVRQRVSHWYLRGTLNNRGEPPPRPVEVHPDAPRSQPRYVFDTEPWVEWFRPGVPGPHGHGWMVWSEVAQ